MAAAMSVASRSSWWRPITLRRSVSTTIHGRATPGSDATT